MNALRIRGGRRLNGEWSIHSAKNAVLPVLAASILTDDRVCLTDCPDLSDIRYMVKFFRRSVVKCRRKTVR